MFIYSIKDTERTRSCLAMQDSGVEKHEEDASEIEYEPEENCIEDEVEEERGE